MKHSEQLMTVLSENNFSIDALGRVIIDDPLIFAEIYGASGSGDMVTGVYSNIACANAAC